MWDLFLESVCDILDKQPWTSEVKYLNTGYKQTYKTHMT